jgi:hypothetical protein
VKATKRKIEKIAINLREYELKKCHKRKIGRKLLGNRVSTSIYYC